MFRSAKFLLCFSPEWQPTLLFAVLQVQLSVLDDGTLAIEANVDDFLAQWPYLSDLSLIWSVASIFQPVAADAKADPADQAATAAATKVLQGAELQPWLYFNLIAHNSHMFVPIMDLVRSVPTRMGPKAFCFDPFRCYCLRPQDVELCTTYVAKASGFDMPIHI